MFLVVMLRNGEAVNKSLLFKYSYDKGRSREGAKGEIAHPPFLVEGGFLASYVFLCVFLMC